MLAREAAPIWRENVVAVVILLRVYQMFEVLAFCNRVKAQPPSITITVLTLLKMKQQQHDINLRRTRKKNPSPRWDLNPRP